MRNRSELRGAPHSQSPSRTHAVMKTHDALARLIAQADSPRVCGEREEGEPSLPSAALHNRRALFAQSLLASHVATGFGFRQAETGRWGSTSAPIVEDGVPATSQEAVSAPVWSCSLLDCGDRTNRCRDCGSGGCSDHHGHKLQRLRCRVTASGRGRCRLRGHGYFCTLAGVLEHHSHKWSNRHCHELDDLRPW